MSSSDDLMKQFLCAALMCGEVVSNDIDTKNPDPVEVFMRGFMDNTGYDIFRDAEDLGFISRMLPADDESDWIVTDKGKEFLE